MERARKIWIFNKLMQNQLDEFINRFKSNYCKWQVYPRIFLSFIPDDELEAVSSTQFLEGERNALQQENDISNNIWDFFKPFIFSPKTLILVIAGIVFGERIGEIFTNNNYLMLPFFSYSGDFLLIYMFKLICAGLGAFLGYKLAKK